MGRQNIYKTLSVASVMPTPMIQDLIDFLITNRNLILPDVKRSDAFRTRFSGNSLMSDIVHRMTILGKDQAYSLIRIPTKTVALREAVDMTFVPIDLLQMKEVVSAAAKSLSLLPELNDKLVVNVTDITKANGDFSDVTQFHQRVVRDFLSRSFYTSTGNVWISPALVRYVAKVYSMAIGGQIARLFGLSDLIRMFIQTVFCLFFVGKMTDNDIAVGFLKSHARQLGIHVDDSLTQILSFVEDILEKKVPESLEDVIKVIDAYDHDQLKTKQGSRLSRPMLNMMVAPLSRDGHVSIIGLEYPPYFTYMVLSALANTPSGLSFLMKKMNLLREGNEVFETLVKSSTFWNGA